MLQINNPGFMGFFNLSLFVDREPAGRICYPLSFVQCRVFKCCKTNERYGLVDRKDTCAPQLPLSI